MVPWRRKRRLEAVKRLNDHENQDSSTVLYVALASFSLLLVITDFQFYSNDIPLERQDDQLLQPPPQSTRKIGAKRALCVSCHLSLDGTQETDMLSDWNQLRQNARVAHAQRLHS